MRRVKVAPKGMGLNDFVAQEEGFFAAEGIQVEFDWKTFRGTQSSWKHYEYFQRPQDKPYTGGFGARLKALLDGEVEAASLLPPQIDMAEQLGLRKIIEDTFHTLWWVPENAEAEVVRGYLRALDRAEKAMDADLAKYLPLWRFAGSPEIETYHAWGFTRVGRGG